MGMIETSDKVKAMIVLVINLVAAAVLGFASIYEWDLALWVPVTSMVVIVLDTVLGIAWVVPQRK